MADTPTIQLDIQARLQEEHSDEGVASVNASLAHSLAQLHVERPQHP